VSNIELPVLRKQAIDGSKRLWRVVPLVTAAALSASLMAGAAGSANAAVREPARTAPISLASSGNALPAVSLTAAARYVHVSDGGLTFGTGGPVASMDKLLDRGTAAAGRARGGVTVDVATAVPAAAQDTTITILPGITLTINSTGIQLSMTKEAVTEVENVVGFGQNVASLVGAILAISGVPLGSQIASIVASSLGLANGLLKLCTASDGSAAFTIPWLGLPSCSGFTLLA
jgi:hypothetical protein